MVTRFDRFLSDYYAKHANRAAQQGVAAERLDRGDFAMQKLYNVFSIYQRDPFQPPAEHQPVRRQIEHLA
jgi:hypothetical protein